MLGYTIKEYMLVNAGEILTLLSGSVLKVIFFVEAEINV